MIKIALVEDENTAAMLLGEYIERYAEKFGEKFSVKRFTNGLEFLEGYNEGYDVVLMDVMMPMMDGMQAATRLRKIDKDVCLIFITNMSNYAVKGYDVGAIDFMIKPVAYLDFEMKLKKAVHISRRSERMVAVSADKGLFRLKISDVLYLHSEKHYVYICTEDEVIRKRATINDMEKDFYDECFARAAHSFIVNFSHIVKIQEDIITMTNGDEIAISRSKKDEFMQKLTVYLGRSVK